MSEFKPGDTFEELLLIPADYEDGFFVGWTIASQIRTPSGRLVGDLNPSWAEPEEDTRAIRLLNENTSRWPLGELLYDVQFTRDSDGYTFSSETLSLESIRDQTRVAAGGG